MKPDQEIITQAKQIQLQLSTQPVIGKLTTFKKIFYKLNHSVFFQLFVLNEAILNLIEAQNQQITELQHQIDTLQSSLSLTRSDYASKIEAQNQQITELQCQIGTTQSLSLPQPDYANEINFWANNLAQKDEFKKNLLTLLDPIKRKNVFPGDLIAHIDELKQYHNRQLKLLEIGSGPTSNLAWGVDQGLFEITAIDPLAEEYAQLMKQHNYNYPIRPIKGIGEDILKMFEQESFDIAYSRNALDHTISPEMVIKNIAGVLKPGGIFYLENKVREGTWEDWQDLHQHDLVIEGDHLMRYDRNGIATNLTKYVKMECISQTQSGDQPGDWFTAIFRKPYSSSKNAAYPLQNEKRESLTATIEVEDFYSYSYCPQRRYGNGKPAHALIESILAKGLADYESLFQRFVDFLPDFLQINKDFDKSKPSAPYWLNGFFPGLDAIALYGMIATHKPRVFCEIGSGNSTKFAVAAKLAHSPQTTIISVDPAPRAGIDQICDTVIRESLQECDLLIFEDLQPGDILFLDGSHRVLQNSDVSVFFLEILPVLRTGVIIHLHDICWPYDYPSEWTKRMYSEQYMLGALLLFAQEKINIILPNTYISYCTSLGSIFNEIWNAPHLQGIEPTGGSFWFLKK